ncbi:hypothetical protein DFH07DRAFT_775282 [Mycena maculata]|uniref:Uncharacterized protein n=1 Tax=Mycena maculata TaxID=230809 RepID=A0AAD7IU37_9AGAR|nr:hypothetical protein DFH07DRAFT_775282 [Mycena maculata]
MANDIPICIRDTSMDLQHRPIYGLRPTISFGGANDSFTPSRSTNPSGNPIVGVDISAHEADSLSVLPISMEGLGRLPVYEPFNWAADPFANITPQSRGTLLGYDAGGDDWAGYLTNVDGLTCICHPAWDCLACPRPCVADFRVFLMFLALNCGKQLSSRSRSDRSSTSSLVKGAQMMTRRRQLDGGMVEKREWRFTGRNYRWWHG